MTDLAYAHALERDTTRYQVEGKRVPSVTEILSIAGFCNFDDVPARMLEEAANRGRIAHAVTAELDLGRPVGTIPPHVKPYVRAYLRFREETDFKPILIEHVVVHERHRYAGTLDRLGELNGALWLIDLKTSVVTYPWVGTQTAGYEQALPPEYRDRPIRRGALRLLKDGTYRLDPLRRHSDAADFLAATRTVHWRIAHGGLRL